jgi:hypothetical protein
MPGYENYGERGIRVCGRWLGKTGFANFLADVGPRPSPSHSLDRFPDNDGDYEPGNVRWATLEEQHNNRRDTVRLEHRGLSLGLAEWSRRTGIRYITLYKRALRGWPAERILETHPGRA